jgi:hypothetical protein
MRLLMYTMCLQVLEISKLVEKAFKVRAFTATQCLANFATHG